MDPITLGFYAVVCGLLSAAAPRVPKLPIRLALGAAVGLIAATVLPWLKNLVTKSEMAAYLPNGFGL